jgi:Domain of unknown function (DUF4833)
MPPLRKLSSLLVGLFTALLATPQLARAEDGVNFGPNDVHSVFHVAKSENQNQVHYGLRLDAACRPVGKQPVFAYWSRYRTTGRVDAPLEGIGQRFYGASDEQKVQVGPTGGRVQMYVKALDSVIVDITIQQSADGCVATPTTSIRGERAQLSRAYLQLGRFGLSVKYVDLVGTRMRDGSRITQRVEG